MEELCRGITVFSKLQALYSGMMKRKCNKLKERCTQEKKYRAITA